MSKIDSINRTSGTSSIGATVSSSYTPPAGGATYHERFKFPEIKLKERTSTDVDPCERLNQTVLIELFMDILQSGVDIVPTLPRDHGEYIVEASFKPTTNKNRHHSIHAPLRGVNETFVAPHMLLVNYTLRHRVTKYVNQIINHSTDEDIIRLIIVISHEFGHYLSFIRGNHDNELKIGLYLLHTKQLGSESGKFTWLVFREESTAWRFAENILIRAKFDFFEEFNQVKFNSLQTYFKSLKLHDASIEINLKLSLMGDDFLKSCGDSDLFKLHKATGSLSLKAGN